MSSWLLSTASRDIPVIKKLYQGYPWLMLFWQDVVLTVPPYPYALGEPSGVLLDECCVVRHQLFFSRHLLPIGGRAKKGQLDVWWGRHPSSTRVLQRLRARGSAQRRPYGSCGREQLLKLYKPSPTPILHVAPAANVLGRTLSRSCPWCPCFSAETLLWPSHISSVSIGAAHSHMCWQMQRTRRARREAASTRSRRTHGCGSLCWANLAWGASQWLRLRSGTLQRWTVVQRRQWQHCSEGAASLRRRQGPVSEWNEDIPRISLIEIFVIEISKG